MRSVCKEIAFLLLDQLFLGDIRNDNDSGDVVADDLICYRGNDYRQLLIVVCVVESEILTDMLGNLLVNR